MPNAGRGVIAENPDVIKRIRELKRAGLSQREIAKRLTSDGVRVSHVSVRRAIRVYKEPTPPPEDADADPIDPQIAEAVKAARAECTSGSVQHLRLRADQIRDLTDKMVVAVAGNEVPASTLATLVKLETELAKRIVELTPAAAPDPQADPANHAARKLLMAHIESLVTGDR